MRLPIDSACLEEARILERAQAHSLHVADAEQLQFLSNLESLDLQAAPGCGKTTLTAFKLCLLASSWRSDTAGVCVLSHTNVAKDQIIELLQRDIDGRRFLSYPHFIGTIQGFVDTFLAKPHLLSNGIDIRAIDDEFYAAAARGALGSGQYPQLANLINPPNPRTDVKQIALTAHYVWVNQALEVRGMMHGQRASFPFGPNTASAQQFQALKKAISDRGIYMYSDMYAFARKHLALHPKLCEALQRRFPFVLIDEMQDTSQDQEAFLSSIFNSPECIVQRVGDVNQRIYSDANDVEPDAAHFPAEGHLSLPRSMRFGDTIATASTPLTLSAPTSLLGNVHVADHAPRLLVFEEASVDQVIPRFAEEVVTHVPPEMLERLPVKAVGARKSGEANEFPRRIQCYWSEYDSEAGKPRKATKFIQVVVAIRARSDLSWKARSDMLWDSCCELLTRWGMRLSNRRPTPGRLLAALRQVEFSVGLRVRSAILMLNSIDIQCEADWSAAMLELQAALRVAFKLPEITAQATAYSEYGTTAPPSDDASVKCQRALIAIRGTTIQIDLATIHSVKGETHAATLVLECFHHVYDLKEVLPIIIGKHDAQRLQNVSSILPAARRTFVAMTRPRNLVAFAIRKSHVEAHIPDFEAAGWKVIYLDPAK